MLRLKAPFPYFGGKSRVADVIWQRMGNVQNYVDPFAGSLAVLLQRPHEPKIETVNDLDCYLANFWRATQHEPEQVAHWCDWPVNEADLHARHRWLLERAEFRERMHSDPDFYDVKIAGWWVWGISQWIGSGWCAEAYYGGNESQQLPHLGNAGMGVHRPSQKRPHLGDAGRGNLYDYFAFLAARLRYVRVSCGDWSRVLGDSVTWRHGVTGILLDPPYSHDERDSALYGQDHDVAQDVQAWAIEAGDNPLLRIVLCGYDTEHANLLQHGWTAHKWEAAGGFGSRGNGAGKNNAKRETLWFSPHCIPDKALRLFDLPEYTAQAAD
jgi:site-specific DNA-adenine methylase